MFDTKSLKEEYRIEALNGHRFNECEVCGAKEPLKSINITYYHRAKKAMCDRCIDNFDGVTIWKESHAKFHGLPPYLGRY